MRFLLLLLTCALVLRTEPLHIFAGQLVGHSGRTMTVRSVDGELTLRLTSHTEIWKGAGHQNASVLWLGDEITGRYVISGRQRIATEVWANLINMDGRITRVHEQAFEVLSYPDADPHSGYVKAHFTVHFGAATRFVLSAPADLISGRSVQIMGLKTGVSSIKASQVIVYEGKRPVRMDSAFVPQ